MKMKFLKIAVVLLVSLGIASLATLFKHTKIKEDTEIQTLGLRKNADMLFISALFPNRDITKEIVAAHAINPPDERFESAMNKLKIDDGFPQEKPPRLVTKEGHEVKVFGKGGNFYVRFVGKPASDCSGIAYAVCP